MKKSNRTVRKMRSAWTGFAAACLAAALTMSALVSCAPQESRPVVTSDDLTPPSAAQEAIAQEAGGGKNYAYYWQAEDIEKTLQEYRAACEEELDYLKDLIEQGEDAVKEVGYLSLADAQKAVSDREAMIGAELENERKRLEEEKNIGPILGPQEAANIAGVIFEKCYGIDLSGQTLALNCYGDTAILVAAENSGMARSLWSVRLDEAADGVLFSTCAADCQVDATTGEVIGASYSFSSNEAAAMRETPVPACFVQEKAPDAIESFGYWDETEASYDETAEALKAQISEALSGSALVGGAVMTDIQIELHDVQTYGNYKANSIYFRLSCDNGKEYHVSRTFFDAPYVNYDCGGYPLRAYQFTNDTYLSGT